jgi:prolyl oligopeptidase
MKKLVLITLIPLTQLMLTPNANAQGLEYPKFQKSGDVIEHFGYSIPDPYRWLEDDRSEDVKAWVQHQNKVTFSHLDEIPYRQSIVERLTAMWNYERISAPFNEGKNTFYFKNNGLQNQSVMFQKTKKGDAVFLDPNTFSKDGTTSLAGLNFSKSGKYCAYQISVAGSDWRKVIVIDTKSKSIIEDTLIDVKFSGISWYKDEGFYYSSYDRPKGSELSEKTDQHKLYYHKLGTKQKDDQVIFGANEKRRYVSASVSKDMNYLFISAANSTSGNELYFKNLKKKNSLIVPIVSNFENDHDVLDTRKGRFYIVTNRNAANKKIVVADAENPNPEHWKDFIPETKFVLSPSVGSGFIFTHYMIDAVSKVMQYDYSGKLIREIKLPGLGTASGFSGKEKDNELYFSFTNYVTPGTIYSFNPTSGETKVYQKPSVKFDSDNYESHQVFYESHDGTKVPMIITHKKGIMLNGENPTMLYGYGGFNISLTPAFSVANALWLEMGGVYAVANLRGGGEYGKAWHDAGTQMQKQNVFEDFIAAAEYLIGKNYTSTKKLAISGRSNGGLLVGAAMTQRPDLFAVALPGVGVLDMLRYHTFTAGAGWAYDYGTAEDSREMFNYLLDYSPVHNVRKEIDYPATMITTADHDDRVVPAHSFKFASELQEKNPAGRPMLIRIDVNAGHGAGKPVAMTIQEYADMMAFALYHTNSKPR